MTIILKANYKKSRVDTKFAKLDIVVSIENNRDRHCLSCVIAQHRAKIKIHPTLPLRSFKAMRVHQFLHSFSSGYCRVYRWPYRTIDSLREDRWLVSRWSAILFWVGNWTERTLTFITRLERTCCKFAYPFSFLYFVFALYFTFQFVMLLCSVILHRLDE